MVSCKREGLSRKANRSDSQIGEDREKRSLRVFFNGQHVASDSGSPEPHFFHQTTHYNPLHFGGPSRSVPVPQADAGPPREDLHQEKHRPDHYTPNHR